MKLRQKIQHIWRHMMLMAVLIIGTVQSSAMSYQEQSSDIIMYSLQAQKQQRYLRQLYKQLFFTPIWTKKDKLSSQAKVLFQYIKDDKTLNRQSSLYQNTIRFKKTADALYARHGTIEEKIDLEFKISQLYEAYTNYAYFGSINWGAFSARISNLMVNDVSTEWVLHRPAVNTITILENTVFGKKLKPQLDKAIPTQYKYRALRKALIKYRNIQRNGGFPKVLFNGGIKKGQAKEGVTLLRERLRMTGDYHKCKDSVEGLQYDKCLQKAVRHFQKRHGLSADATVGSGTLWALNKSVKSRITTIQLNLDRIKWLKNRTAKRHVIINIPDFKLYFEENGKLIQTIKTIVGRPNNPTPIFSNSVKTIVLNPYWNLPLSIIQKEMIPKLLKSSKAMKKKGIEIYSGWGKDAKKIDPATVKWKEYLYSKSIPYRFAQLPGARNALGKIKFLFPNKYAVYMHDTPNKKLFNRKTRAFSHGCVRLHKPLALLKTFSKFNSNIDMKKSHKILKGKEKTYFGLEERVPVDIIYLTAWIDYNGILQFRNDIYGYDAMQLKSFRHW